MSELRDRMEQLSPLQRATVALKEMRARLDAAERARRDPIAIVGMACRFPGGANHPEAFWRILRDGVDATSEVPPDRWDSGALHDPDPDAPGKMYTCRSGFLKGHDVDRFDAAFFRISPREARGLDPQQRLLLELTWEALEDAGQPPDRLTGSRTGVYVGIATTDYTQLGLADLESTDPYIATGTAINIAAGRLSFILGLRGPTMALDTACSSSLVGVHLACQSLRAEESDLALVCGVNLILTPLINVIYSRMRALAPDGRCKAFDAAADGMVRGEGGAVVVLKRHRDALRDGDNVLALIRGSAVNHDGRSSGLTVPNGAAQREVLRAALASAGVAPAEVRFVETHGTGTTLGDPIEANALVAEMGAGRAEDAPLILGSAKANVGHLEAAAGLVGLIKVVLSLQHGEIPPQIHFRTLNPEIMPSPFPLLVPTEVLPWPEGAGPRIAGVSSFGASGTNAHLVIEGVAGRLAALPTALPTAPPTATLTEAGAPFEATSAEAWILPLSAGSPEALRELGRSYQLLLTERPELPLADLCYSASVRRAHLERRLAVVGRSREELAEALQAFLQGEIHPHFFAGVAQPGRVPRLAFVFSGHSGHWVGMGRSLLEREPAFREAFLACDRAMAPHASGSLLAELTAADAEARWERPEVLQPLVFAMQVALSAAWRSWGIEPDVVVGHSMGEVAAAHVAGALSLDDAARLCRRRSEIIGRVQGKGAMAVVALSREQAQAALAGHEDRLSVGVCNSRVSTALSGDPAALEEVVAKLARRNVFARMIKGATAAGHSPQMDPLLPDLMASLDGLAPRATTAPLYSTVTAALSEGGALGPGYWARNLREPVLFAQTIEQMGLDGVDAFVEIGPHPVLLGAIEQVLRPQGGTITAVPSIKSDEPERVTLLASLGRLFVAGTPVDWARLYPSGGRFVPLPSYPWQRQRYWVAGKAPSPAPGPAPSPALGSPRPGGMHPLLDQHVVSARPPREHHAELTLDRERLPYVGELHLQGIGLVSAAIYVEMALAAAAKMLPPGGRVIEDLTVHEALLLEEDAPATLQLILSPGPAPGEASFQVHGRASAAGGEPFDWTLQASGRVRAADDDPLAAGAGDSPEAVQARCSETGDGAGCYPLFRARGLDHGPSFQGIERLWRGAGEALGRIRLPEAVARSAGAYCLHPALLDGAFQVICALAQDPEAPPVEGELVLPSGLARLTIHVAGGRSGEALWCHAVLRSPAGPTAGARGDLRLLDGSGKLLAEIQGLRLDPLDRKATRRIVGARLEDWLYAIEWQRCTEPPARPAQAPRPGGRWLILADEGGLGRELGRRLEQRGEGSILVLPGPRFAAPPEGPLSVASVAPEAPDGFDALLAEARARGPVRGVIHLWSLDASPPEQTTVASLVADERLGSVAVLHLVQALARSGEAARVWLVTRNVQPVGPGSGALAVAQAPLWGLGKVVALEHPDLWGRLIDLDPAAPDDEAAALLAEIDAPDDEDFVALRGGARHVARLVRTPEPRMPATPIALREGAAYLITGGLGGAGLEVARWLVDRGARHLVIAGRRGLPTPEQRAALTPGSDLWQRLEVLRALEARGVTVRVVRADAGSRAEMAAVLKTVHAAGLRLRGVIHAAGVSAEQLLVGTTAEVMRSVHHPKIAGTWVLHELTRGLDLDFFVCFSSAASIWGGAALGPYAAANHFMDTFAHHRRALGLPAISVNWGGWGGSGGMATAEVQRIAARMGLNVVPPAQMLEGLDAFLQARTVQITIGPINWRLFKPLFEVRRRHPLFEQIEVPPDGPSEAGGERGSFLQRLQEIEPDRRWDLLVAHVRELASDVLGLEDPRALDRQQGFFQMGMDSIMSVQLRGRLEASLGKTLPPTLAFEHPTVDALAGYLAREVLAVGQPAEAPALSALAAPGGAAAPPAAAQASLDGLSDDHLEALLAAELGLGQEEVAL